MTLLDEMIDNLPAGLDRAILRALSFSIGRDHSIPRASLLNNIRAVGFKKLSDRQLRLQINQLRKDGHVICSIGGIDGGYYIAGSWDELNEYLQREVHSRAMDLLEQEKALREAGEKTWGKYSPTRQGSFM